MSDSSRERNASRIHWLVRNLRHPTSWLCFKCFSAHIEQCRDIQNGDVCDCKAGKHYGEERP